MNIRCAFLRCYQYHIKSVNSLTNTNTNSAKSHLDSVFPHIIVIVPTLSSLPLIRASFLFLRWDTAAIFNPTNIRTTLGTVWKFIKFQSIWSSWFFYIPFLWQKAWNFFYLLHSLFRPHLHLKELSVGTESRINLNIL